MKKILVTGGAGFIGSNFIHHIMNDQENNDYVINLDALTYAGNLNNLSKLTEHHPYELVVGDIMDEKLVESVFENHQIDWVVNFAAESHVDRSINDPKVFLKTNVMGTQTLLDQAKKSWQTGKDEKGYPLYREGVKYLQVSTDEVYGALGNSGHFTEETPLNPTSPYSASKAAADLLTMAYHKTYKLPVNITRCSNNYGPYQFPEKLIPLMIMNTVAGKTLPVYGDGMQIRDWLHVKDHCRAIEKVLHFGKTGEIYNIGGNNEKANIEIVRLIIRLIGKSEKLIGYVEDRLGHDRRYAVDNTKITNELGWKPEYTFNEGIRETIEWYLENREWMADIESGNYRHLHSDMNFKEDLPCRI